MESPQNNPEVNLIMEKSPLPKDVYIIFHESSENSQDLAKSGLRNILGKVGSLFQTESTAMEMPSDGTSLLLRITSIEETLILECWRSLPLPGTPVPERS